MDLQDKPITSRNHRSTEQSVSQSSRLNHVHSNSSLSLLNNSKVSVNCLKSLHNNNLTVKSQPNLRNNRSTAVMSQSFLRTLIPSYGSTFKTHALKFSHSGTLLVVMLMAAVLCCGVDGKSVKIKKCAGMICQAHEFCDRGTMYCESCQPFCSSRDEINQRICQRQCQEYLSLFTTSSPSPLSLSLAQKEASQEGPGGLDRNSYTVMIAGILLVAVLLVGLIVVAIVMLRKVAKRKAVDPVSLSSVQDSEDTACKQSLAGSAVNDNEENNERQEETDLSFSASGHKVAQPTDSSKSSH